MSPSTAPLPCSFTRTARILPLSRPHTVTSCAITVPTTSAPSPIRTFGARNSPSIRPKICAAPLHSTLPTIDMSGPMQETVPAVVADSGLALSSAATECCDCVNVSSAAFASAFLFLPGALLLNMSTPFFGIKIQRAIDPHHYRRTAPHPDREVGRLRRRWSAWASLPWRNEQSRSALPRCLRRPLVPLWKGHYGRGRDRGRHCSIRARLERRADGDGNGVGGESSRDRHARGAAQAARGVQRSNLRWDGG